MPEPQPQGLLAKTQMPNFSILGMLMGGRGYASDWFSTRDKLNLAQAEVATEATNRQNSVNTLVGGPQWKAMLADPNNRQVLSDLWARSQQANIDPTTGKTVTGLFERGMENIAGRESQTYANQLQRGNMTYADQLQRQQMQYSQQLNQENQLFGQKIDQENTVFQAQTALDFGQQKQQAEAKAEFDTLTRLFPDSPGIVTALQQSKKMQDYGASVTGGTMPAVVNGPQGPMIVDVPRAGSPIYNEQMPKMIAQDQLVSAIDQVVSNIDKGAVYTADEIEGLRLAIGEQFRKASGTGSLDEGTQKLLNEMFPPALGRGGNWSQTVRNEYAEKWRVASMVQKQKLTDMKKYFIMPVDVNASQLGGTRTKQMAEDAANAANAATADQQKQITGPQSNPRFGQPKVTGGQTGKGGGSIWNPSAKTRTGGGY